MFTLRLVSPLLFGDLLCGHVGFCQNRSAEYNLGIDVQLSGGWSVLIFFERWGMGKISMLCLKAEWKYYVRMSGCKPVCCECAISVTGH